MRLWVLNQYAVPPELPGGTRHFDLARELTRRGHDVTIIASSFHYSLRREVRRHQGLAPVVETLEGARFVWVRTLAYRGNNVRRLANMLSYSLHLFPSISRAGLASPDVVIGSSVHPFTALSAWLLGRLYRVPFIFEVRDIWPQTLIDGGFSPTHPFIQLLSWLETFLYRRADAIVTVLPGAVEHMVSRGAEADRIHCIPNGIELRGLPGPTPRRREPKQPFTVLYAGAHGDANGLDIVLEAAARLQEEEQGVRFVLLGDGPERARLKTLSEERGLRNLIFLEPVSKAAVHDHLREADTLLFHLRTLPVFRYGISPNKLFDYLASGRPILFGCRAGNNPVEEAGAGVSFEPENGEALAEAVRTVRALPLEERERMGERGRRFVQAHHSIEALADRFERVVREVAGL